MRAANIHLKMLKVLGVGAAAALLALAPQAASAGKFKVLHSFCASQDGCRPVWPLVMDTAGNLYGTTPVGGSHSEGVAFELKRTDAEKYKYKVIWNFFNFPTSGLIIDTQGNLYGEDGGVFKLSYGFGNHHNKWQAGDFEISCPQGNCGTVGGGLTYAGASAGLPYDGSSPLYGVGSGGDNDAGTVFELVSSQGPWTETVLHSFCSTGGNACTDGKDPGFGVTLDQSGNVYGTTLEGGLLDAADQPAGVLFELSNTGGSWTETVLHSFCSEPRCADGDRPVGTLVIDGQGRLIGATEHGGGCKPTKYGCGLAYAITADGAQSPETVLHDFCSSKDCRDGELPVAGLTLGPSGNLFGTTMSGGGNDVDGKGTGGGVIYEISASYQTLYEFCHLASCDDGRSPAAPPILGPSGEIYGTTALGGVYDGGTAFSVQP